MELYKRMRPRDVSGLVGQPEAVGILRGWSRRKDVPHAVMLFGPSGCGKTTTARIIKRLVGCRGSDYQEINAATETGIATIRRMDDVLRKVPMVGESRVWVLDECHKLTTAAQDGMLKILEESPPHAYVVLCTTDPQKVIRTVHTRCTKIKLDSIAEDDLKTLLRTTLERVAQGKKVHDDVLDQIVEQSDGSARQALVILDSVRKLKTKEDMLAAVVKAEHKKQAIDLARLLVKPAPRWTEIAPVLKALTDDAEGTRRLVLGYVNSVMLGGGQLAGRAAAVYEVFRDMFVNGKVDLTAACFAVSKGS